MWVVGEGPDGGGQMVMGPWEATILGPCFPHSHFSWVPPSLLSAPVCSRGTPWWPCQALHTLTWVSVSLIQQRGAASWTVLLSSFWGWDTRR